MGRSRFARVLGVACVFAFLLSCDAQKPASGSSHADDEDAWISTDTLRAVIDVFNFLVLIAEHCGPSAAPGECGGLLILLAVGFLVFVLVCACLKCLGITCERNHTLEDVTRLYNTGHSLDVIAKWQGGERKCA